jgi:hypothetical protein
MAEQKQYLRLTIAQSSFLLPSATGFTIEQRDNLLINSGRNGNVAAWRVVRNNRQPAYALDGAFKAVRRDDWQRAVYVESTTGTYGIVVDDVYLLPRAQVATFIPLGAAPVGAGHLFNGVATAEGEVMLMLDPRTFSAYLQSLGE